MADEEGEEGGGYIPLESLSYENRLNDARKNWRRRIMSYDALAYCVVQCFHFLVRPRKERRNHSVSHQTAVGNMKIRKRLKGLMKD